ncbi:TPA: hypothetical protein ACKOMY_002358 [Clostridioides difficile]|uniref:Tyr recombinase domain-containing protein n=1 Tax=Clostridioides difficile NAP08 TaxID=525259 RepID=D5PZV3_CLODI|nr:hypothetical protein [Clostridioides difficile]EFH08780.1 hypothetical protein HMPREF0220_0185 [Clostridioides difficile NAP08]
MKYHLLHNFLFQANIKDIQHRLGHAKISTTMDTYSHVTNNMRNQTVNIFESIVE